MTELEYLLIVVASGITYLLSRLNTSKKIKMVLTEINDALSDNIVTKEELERIIKTLTTK
jgi:hypothetical protein